MSDTLNPVNIQQDKEQKESVSTDMTDLGSVPESKYPLSLRDPNAKYLVVVDDTPEFEKALYFAAYQAKVHGGLISLAYICEKTERTPWGGLDSLLEESSRRAGEERLIQESRRLLQEFSLWSELFILDKTATLVSLITLTKENQFSAFILASSAARSPGRLLSQLSSSLIGSMDIPFIIVPENISFEKLKALS